jgi:hypothetical protein
MWEVSVQRKVIMFVHFMSTGGPTNMFSAGIMQQLGDTGSALATLVDITAFSVTAQNLT